MTEKQKDALWDASGEAWVRYTIARKACGKAYKECQLRREENLVASRRVLMAEEEVAMFGFSDVTVLSVAGGGEIRGA